MGVLLARALLFGVYIRAGLMIQRLTNFGGLGRTTAGLHEGLGARLGLS